MLEIKQKVKLKLPKLPKPAISLQFAPATDEDDELIQAISDDVKHQDDVWELSERPDPTELQRYWEKVEEDIRHDPEWVWLNDEV